ncbi:MAG: bifunctional (p)ppGpp synthetase/guanosine-3',5'-bis(diphosphate) 3'-pyrophosphohydrolase [Myxococcales bacterium]|nr:bifunctional (p)ppGpp synthetase/guanosine-3',5'-bis(diphosphate) 3'-pyrophosphohydrolase [Myxococcales bacterium]
MSPTISDIMERIQAYSPDADLQPVMTAYLLAARAHAGQMRKSGEPYLTHPLSVAMILADLQMDVETIATALLHDALEDNPITKEEMRAEIGATVTDLVDGVTKIGKLRFRSREELAAENFRKMMLAMSRDLRVILVKLADRLHNMSTLQHHKEAKRIQIATETMDIYVPIANRLGLSRLKAKLEDLCFGALHPEARGEILDYLEETQSDRERYTQTVIETIRGHLEGHGVSCKVTGRAKESASIYRKMVNRGIQVSEVPDLLAFRVLVDDLGTCYAALGLVHANMPPVPDRIKDYIARPKPNGYQSLHTTVCGPEDRRVEIQFRTHDMDRIAEEGIAAHWRYKEGHLALSPDDVLRISKIRELFESVQDSHNAADFMEAVKVEFYADEVFVFTPMGDVKRFPMGATALDFAYAVHTEVGNHCTGARVNGKQVPLRYVLQSGDSIEVLTSEQQRPNRDWLEVARTGRAIQKIRKYLRDEEQELGARLGRHMLDAELRKHGWDLARVKLEGRLKECLKARGHKEIEALFVEVARGQVVLGRLVADLLPEGTWQAIQDEARQNALSTLFNRFRRPTTSPVLISGEDGLLVAFARCCSPLPGESVVGFITRGRGITVHRSGCEQLSTMDPERRIPVEWDDQAQVKHTGEIRIFCSNRPGMLANITKICEQVGVNINRAEATTEEGTVPASVILELSLRDVHELTRLVRNIEKLPGVEAVHRTVG